MYAFSSTKLLPVAGVEVFCLALSWSQILFFKTKLVNLIRSFEGTFNEGSFSDVFRSASRHSLDGILGARAITSAVTRISSFGILAIILIFSIKSQEL